MKLPDSVFLGKGICCVIVLAVTTVAVFFRIPRLELRPMHGDEAVHAERFRQLLEEGVYTYDPEEYHGPSLNYLTLVPAWLIGAHKFSNVTEFTLRIVPVFFGILLSLFLLLLVSALGRMASLFACILTAISPAMVFYSRYYIQEILLVCFTFGTIVAGYHYARSRNVVWALLLGAFLGLMHATKETCIIAFGAMVLALLLTLFARQRNSRSFGNQLKAVKLIHILAALIAAFVISFLFHSSFMRNPEGVLDSFRTYGAYFERGGGNSLHFHSWYYYIKMLIYSRYDSGPIWSEALIVFLAIVGFIAVLRATVPEYCDIKFLRFLAFYTIIMTVIYSAIPYKTPWCLLSFLHGMILLAGVGAVTLLKLSRKVLVRVFISIILVAASAHLVWQAYISNFRYYVDPRNPYVYAHPTTDVFIIAHLMEQYAQVHEDGYKMRIEVICPGDDYWPLPWYLRRFSQVHWHNNVSDDVADSAIIIASANRQIEKALVDKIYTQRSPEKRQMFMFIFEKPYYVWLRPNVKLIGMVRKDLWESFQKRQIGSDQVETQL